MDGDTIEKKKKKGPACLSVIQRAGGGGWRERFVEEIS